MSESKNQVTYKPGKPGNWTADLNWKHMLKAKVQSYVIKSEKIACKYEVDTQRRVCAVKACIKPGVQSSPRHTSQQRIVGKWQNSIGDHGGHIIPSILGGSGQSINMVPMLQKLNQGDWRRMENSWRKILENGGVLEIHIVNVYPNASSRRPSRFIVNHKVDGVTKRVQRFIN